MNLNKLKNVALGLALSTIIFACETDSVEKADMPSQSVEILPLRKGPQKSGILSKKTSEPSLTVPENLGSLFKKEAVEPTDCGPTKFVAVQNYYLNQLVSDPYWDYGAYSTYSDLSLYIAYFDTDEQYFGANGEYTHLVNKRKRELERFWDMPGQVRVNGQHTATLNDRDKVAFGYQLFGFPEDIAYQAADQVLAYNALSEQFPENPFFALDGFATPSQLIVLGDGLIRMLSETGIDTDIVYTGVLAHEWAHQVQFLNGDEWYPEGADPDPVADTRYTELEADFMAAYFMTHKRGATYNWKRVEEFFTLFFRIGDCGFDNDGHHGTPLQRMAAAQLGYNLAASAQKQGHILSQQEAHEYFVSHVQSIL